jgi:glycosyltransferase involved in cell wall biosynthesis
LRLARGFPNIVLDRYAYAMLLAQRRDRVEGVVAPLRWFGVLDDLSHRLSGKPIVQYGFSDFIFARSILFSSNPTFETALAAIRGQGLVYLCWAVPYASGLKRGVLKFILSRAQHVAVNDIVTRQEVVALTDRTPEVIPYVIDVNFFEYKPPEAREMFLFCAGSNDRDPAVILGLAEQGHRVVWLVNDPADILRTKYAGRHPRLEIKSHLTFQELRTLYQSCAMVIMPASRDIHPAGQTTSLEAIACGAPVLISQSRTATIFSDLPSVVTVATPDPAEWSRAAFRLCSDRAALKQAVERSAQIVRQRISPSAVESAITGILTR